ncbi:hypothetical protein Pla22_33570 [Rubripirellula amarantea]|uniref:Uncharacterized protein n=1 Tax=Rubripirellula amarantea TaxID=2527999 RepID=A0A5C5WIG7_9BACT|nr:hypothetical protein [Rubripirellula amarantea]TWT50614.1 hypothetical protein Pla22_33570 [Rubripirellula amarantea]
MNDRLAPLIFMPPPTGKLWTGTSADAGTGTAVTIRRSDESVVNLPLPAFWLDPPWHRIPAVVADVVAGIIADMGVVVSALLRDLSEESSPASFHSAEVQVPRHRMIPYRPERYGLLADDFDHVSVVDLRLATTRDENGRFAYSPKQIQRWEATADDAPLAGGGWVPAATFPPDVPSLDHLNAKIDQLHALAPKAAVMVSMNPHRIAAELPLVLSQNPDGVILRCDDVGFDGLMMAAATRFASRAIAKSGNVIPLWIHGGDLTPSDAAKLVQLGASAVSMDSWCNQVIYRIEATLVQSSAARLGYNVLRDITPATINALVQEEVQDELNEYLGLCEAAGANGNDERLIAKDGHWAKTLGLKQV